MVIHKPSKRVALWRRKREISRFLSLLADKTYRWREGKKFFTSANDTLNTRVG